MKLRVTFTIEEGDAALSQVAACVGFANTLGVAMTMIPEEGPKRERVRFTEELSKSSYAGTPEVRHALAIFDGAGPVLRKSFVDALAKKTKQRPRDTGKLVTKWIREGVLEEVA